MYRVIGYFAIIEHPGILKIQKYIYKAISFNFWEKECRVNSWKSKGK
jgi:hypothetical protein